MTLTRTQHPDAWIGTHIEFECLDIRDGQKTARWDVWTRSADNPQLLGDVHWYGAWRKYCFFPEDNCIFEEVCMREISDFIVARTKEQRAK